MCYAIPGKIIQKKNNIAVVDYFGEKKNVLCDFEDVEIGDYVYAQGGILINKIPNDEALEILSTWKEIFFKLKQVDKNLTQIKDQPNQSLELLSILQKINLNKNLDNQELLKLLSLKNKEDLELLYTTANNTRQKIHDNACCVHGIIEFSNYCGSDCFYCGIRKSKKIKRYRMTPVEILDIAKHAVKNLGFKALVIQSGEDSWYTEEKLIEIVKNLRKLNILVFLSIGSRSKKLYEKLYKAGARAALLRFETSNKNIFERIRPNTTFDKRINLVKYLDNLGYIVATGFLTGLPDETDQDVINNILLTKSINPDMYSFGPLIPVPDTPLENEKLVDKNRILKIIAITRLIDKKSKILVTTALETLDKNCKKEGLLAGANSLMINVTPSKYKNLYQIYPNRSDKDIEINKNIKKTTDLLFSIGRAPTDIGI